MPANNPYAAYKSTQTLTAGKTKLLVMLHDGAIRFLAQAAQATASKDFPSKGKYFGKAFAIVNHLIMTVDKENGGQLALDLERFYTFIHAQMMIANIQCDVALIKQIMMHLRSIREAWSEVDREVGASAMSLLRTESDGLKAAA